MTDERDNADRQQVTGADKQLNPVRDIPSRMYVGKTAARENAATHSVVYKIKEDHDHNSTCGNADESEAFMVLGHRGIRQGLPMPRGRVQQLQGHGQRQPRLSVGVKMKVDMKK